MYQIILFSLKWGDNKLKWAITYNSEYSAQLRYAGSRETVVVGDCIVWRPDIWGSVHSNWLNWEIIAMGVQYTIYITGLLRIIFRCYEEEVVWLSG